MGLPRLSGGVTRLPETAESGTDSVETKRGAEAVTDFDAFSSERETGLEPATLSLEG